MTWDGPQQERQKRTPLADPAPANFYGQPGQYNVLITQTDTDDEQRSEWIDKIWARLEEGR